MTKQGKQVPKIPAIFRRFQAWDDAWLLRINAKAPSAFTRFVEFFSFCGRMIVWLLVGISFLLIWYLPLAALYFALNLIWGFLSVYLCKMFVNRPRPFQVTPGVKVWEGPNTSASFPSLHAYSVMSGVLVMYAIIENWIVLVIGIPFAILVGLTRPYLGVHYLTDVLGGWIIGLCGAWISIAIAPLFSPWLKIAENLLPITLVTGTWNPFLANAWYWLVIVGVYLVLLYLSIIPRKKRKAKVAWS